MSREIFDRAKRIYDSATASYWAQRDNGGIAPLDMSLAEDAEEHAKGVRFKCTTPAARMVLGVWQKAKAELDAAAHQMQREAGNEECPTCPKKDALARVQERIAKLGEPDRRLPPEPDEEGIPF